MGNCVHGIFATRRARCPHKTKKQIGIGRLQKYSAIQVSQNWCSENFNKSCEKCLQKRRLRYLRSFLILTGNNYSRNIFFTEVVIRS